jgi:hypothetical protein
MATQALQPSRNRNFHHLRGRYRRSFGWYERVEEFVHGLDADVAVLKLPLVIGLKQHGADEADEGLKAAVTKVLRATWQRCRVHFMRNATAHAGKNQRRLVSAWIGTAFAEADAPAAHAQWRRVADQLRPKAPKLAELMDTAEHDVLAYMDFSREHHAKIHSTNPIERLNGEIKQRTDVVDFFPNEAAITRLIGAILLEQSDEWATQRARYMTLETISSINDNPTVSLPAVAA